MKDLIHEKTGIQPVGRTQTGAWEKDEKEGEAEWSCYILTLNPPAPRVGGGGVENVGVKLRLRNCRGDREVVVRCNNFQFCFSLLKCILIGNKLNYFFLRLNLFCLWWYLLSDLLVLTLTHEFFQPEPASFKSLASIPVEYWPSCLTPWQEILEIWSIFQLRVWSSHFLQFCSFVSR